MAGPIGAASTGTTQLFTIQAGGAATNQGDDITSSGDTYHYYIEVPPGLASWTLEIFDADIGFADDPADSSAGRDQFRTASNRYNSTCFYRLTPPGGVPALIFTGTNLTNTCPTGGGAVDNAWCPFVQSPATAGHWDLQVDCPNLPPNPREDDSNAIGIRAHDGTVGSGGTELNVYYDSYTNYGRNDGNPVRTYNNYPWVTRNCTARLNNFDADDSDGAVTTLGANFSVTSRTGAFTSGAFGSPDNDWDSPAVGTALASWVDLDTADDYGIWSASILVRPANTGVQNRNYLTFSMTDSDTNLTAAGPGASSQPDANAYRVYLSTDAIDDVGGSPTAPVKPYMSQHLAHVSGPNPAQTGMMSTYAITVSVVNPTLYPITFSSSDFIRSLVPTPANGTVTYGGLLSLSPGSATILFQPLVGGTGFIDWNPGTLTAGATASISYRVDLIPTLAAPQIIPVTGVPGDLFSGMEAGSTATYLDETGNSSQALATYVFGPICQLSVSTEMLTYALVADITAYEESGKVVVEWETATEVGTVGFDLERVDAQGKNPVRVNAVPIPALAGAPQGARYRWADAGAPTSGKLRYVLIERDVDGRRNHFGPFEVEVKPAPAGAHPGLDATGYAAEARTAAHDLLPAGRLEAAPAAAPPSSPNGPNNEFKIAVREPGLYKLDYGALLAQFAGTPRQGAAGRRGLSLKHNGREIAWAPADTPRSLYFYAEAIDSPYTTDNVYWLSLGVGSRMRTESAAPVGPATPAASFPSREHFEVDTFVATAIAADPDSDYWFWKSLAPGTGLANQSFTLNVADPVTAGSAQLEVGLRAATTSGVVDEHHVEVWLNGTKIGDAIWEGKIAHVAAIPFDPARLQAGNNLVELRSIVVPGAAGDVMYLDAFDLDYPRLYRATGDRLEVSGAGHGTVAVTGFSEPDIRLYRITDPERPVVVSGGVVEGGPGDYSLRFSPASPSDVYLALTPSAILDPVQTSAKAALPNFGQGADYLVIAPQTLMSAAERLADYRTSQGHSGRAVALEAIFDAYRGGIPDPNAIRDFLTEAASWPIATRYVVLAGEGTLDYKNLLGHGGNLIPPKMVQTADGLFSSDLSLGDVSGNDGVPEVIVGRVSVVNTAELDAWIDKLIAYEAGSAAATDTLLLLADNPDSGGDFTDASQQLATLSAGRPVAFVSLEGATTVATRTALFSELASGANILTYSGHGGIDRLATEGLLTTADMPTLAGLTSLPVVTAFTCTIGRFEVPGFPSLAEELVRRSGGAMAVWAPSGLALTHRSTLLGDRFLRAIYQNEERVLGDAMATALGQLAVIEPDSTLVWNLFGDPALRLQIAPPVEPGGIGGDV
ncbi:MAG: hypothetical protein HC897_06545 [Thermoanaerobaculia bacterium]|nr:hypothetical protein [Thermoanaerobaculia bacterium]